MARSSSMVCSWRTASLSPPLAMDLTRLSATVFATLVDGTPARRPADVSA
ncbi:hypothetical protein [Streptomyces xanthophaeus]|nr:hypothetical protein [Streptomyces xanthophaeus]WKD31426.1 hypothetical protein KO717_05300 [Streptomyces xanthophaeus]